VYVRLLKRSQRKTAKAAILLHFPLKFQFNIKYVVMLHVQGRTKQWKYEEIGEENMLALASMKQIQLATFNVLPFITFCSARVSASMIVLSDSP
jgi:hypothetical protein